MIARHLIGSLPTGQEMTLTDWIGVAGFALAVLLGLLRLWELFRRSKFELYSEWGKLGDGTDGLEMTVANVGWKKDSLVFLRFRTPAREGGPPDLRWLEWEVRASNWPNLPAVVLDVNEVAGHFSIAIDALEETGFGRLARELVDGQAQAVLVNARMKETFAPIPSPNQGPRPSTQEVLGRDARRVQATALNRQWSTSQTQRRHERCESRR